MHAFLLWLSVVLLAAPPGEPADDPRPEKEWQRFQGNWEIIHLEVSGKEVPPADYKNIRRLISGNTAVWKNGDQTVLEMTLSIDHTQSPKTLDSTIAEGEQRGQVLKSIYEFTSDDEMRACTAPPGMPRPGEFDSSPEGYLLFVFRRLPD